MSSTGPTTTIAPSPPPASHAQPGRVTPLRVLASEWVKFRSLRSSWVTMLIALVGMVGIGALIGWATNAHWSHMDPIDRVTFEPVSRSLTGTYLAQLVIGVLGVLVITGEYASGMIRATLTAVPKRLPVLWAKLVVVTSLTIVFMTAGAFGAFFLGQDLLDTHGVGLGAPHAVRAVMGVALYLTVVAAIALGIGFIVRNTAGGIASVFGLLLVLPVIANALPSSWQSHLVPYLPSEAGSQLFNLAHGRFNSQYHLAPWTGFAVMCAWAAGLLIIGGVLLRRRDA